MLRVRLKYFGVGAAHRDDEVHTVLRGDIFYSIHKRIYKSVHSLGGRFIQKFRKNDAKRRHTDNPRTRQKTPCMRRSRGNFFHGGYACIA